MVRYHVYLLYTPHEELPVDPSAYGITDVIDTHDPDHKIVVTIKPLDDINWPCEKLGEFDSHEEARRFAEDFVDGGDV